MRPTANPEECLRNAHLSIDSAESIDSVLDEISIHDAEGEQNIAVTATRIAILVTADRIGEQAETRIADDRYQAVSYRD